MSNQTLDILVAEMLGDIGKLHDQVADLKVELPKILHQMQAVIAAQAAKADDLQEPTQRAIQSFIRQEMKGIKVAVKEAQESAISSLDGDISCAVRKNLDWAQYKCEQSFGAVATKFDTAVTESAKVAEGRATETLKGLSQGLKTGSMKFVQNAGGDSICPCSAHVSLAGWLLAFLPSTF